jgi:uncharacterized protein YabE (DUF348 family)
MIALAAVGVAAMAFPLARPQVRADHESGQTVLVVGGGLSAALHSQAETIVSALTQVEPTPTPQASASPQSLDGLGGSFLVPRSLLATAADILVRGALVTPDGEEGLVTEMGPPVRFNLYQDGLASNVFSTRLTVGSALNALGAGISSHDLVWPPPETPLTAGLHVFVEHAKEISLSVGGDGPSVVYSHADTVADLLAEHGVELSEQDSVTPALATPLSDGLAVSVAVVRVRTEYEDTPIPFETIYRDDSSLIEGEYALVQQGQDGFVRREYAVVYENGEAVNREKVSEYTVPPTYEIIAQGTAVVAAAVAAPVAPSGDPQCGRSLTVWATWYTAASARGSGVTATGTTVRKGTVAVDPRVIPLGTRMYIPGYGYGVAEDTGSAIIGNIIDLGYGPNDAKDWRSGWTEICILN